MGEKKPNKFYAECTDCDYVGEDRDTMAEAEADAEDHQEDEPDHIVDVIG